MKKVYNRIMIFGRPGSGKSTFAFQIHKKTNLPLYHLDKYFYTHNWVERNYKEFLSLQQELVDQDQWIIDGNCTKSFLMRWQRADIVIYFHYPRMLCYWRVVKRLFFKDQVIDDRAVGCKEKVSWRLLTYMWSFNNRVKIRINTLKQIFPETSFIEIRNDQELNCFIREFGWE